MTRPPAYLALSDGQVFEGQGAGALLEGGSVTGEAVFNTALSGYQEVMTDPSYAGQVVAFTYPHLGNYGVNDEDAESSGVHLAAVVARQITARPSSWRASQDLESYLAQRGVPAIVGVDTRRLTRVIREHGALPCAITTDGAEAAVALASAAHGTDGCDLATGVSTRERYVVGSGPRRIVAVDFGIKASILVELGKLGQVTVLPSSTTREEVLAEAPDGLFLSNGPGDPAAVAGARELVQGLAGEVPLFGICLGHQILGIALGGEAVKLPFGHHGSNHPVKDLATGRVEVTAQNHNYAIVDGSVPGATTTHRNLNDGVLEGLAVPSMRAFSVQHHPEAGPGPHEARAIFSRFATLMDGGDLEVPR